jgi:hypothetical protein
MILWVAVHRLSTIPLNYDEHPSGAQSIIDLAGKELARRSLRYTIKHAGRFRGGQKSVL